MEQKERGRKEWGEKICRRNMRKRVVDGVRRGGGKDKRERIEENWRSPGSKERRQ